MSGGGSRLADDSERLSTSMVESLLTAIAYAGSEASPLLAVLQPDHFEGIYGDIARNILTYRHQFKEPPAPAHLDDIFDEVLSDPDHKLYRQYNRILVGMREQAPSLNLRYLVERVTGFARQQRLKEGVLMAAERYQQGGDTVAEDVERILTDTLRQRVETVDLGERMNVNPLSFLDEETRAEKILLKIPLLDRLGLVPTRREAWGFLAPRKKGKSWMLQHCCKRAAQISWNAVYISLENRTPMVKQRFVQSWFSAAKRDEEFVRTSLTANNKGTLDKLDFDMLHPRLVLYDPSHRPALEAEAQRHRNKMGRVLVKEFPSGALTIQQLDNWLDAVESETGFVPDLIALDYPQLMKLDPRDLRGSFGRVTVELRGLASRRNAALAIAMQGNRQSETTKIVGVQHMAEDISQAATVDTLISYNQTKMERALGLARLHVAAARNDMDQFTVLISQAYTTGQFALESVRFGSNYDGLLEGVFGDFDRETHGAHRREGADDTENTE